VGLVGLTLRPEYYRQNALEFLRQAKTMSDPRSKAMLIDIAVAWRRVEDQVESISHRPYPTVASDRLKDRRGSSEEKENE
jgi:hypothetical protein